MANTNSINDPSLNTVNPQQLQRQVSQSPNPSAGGGFSKLLDLAGPQGDRSGGNTSSITSAVLSAVTGGGTGSFLGGIPTVKNFTSAPPGGSVGGGGGSTSGDFNNLIDGANIQQLELLGLQIKMQNNVTFTNLYSNLEKTRGEALSRIIQNIRQG